MRPAALLLALASVARASAPASASTRPAALLLALASQPATCQPPSPAPTSSPGSGTKKKKEKSFFEAHWNVLLFGGVIGFALVGRARGRMKRRADNDRAGVAPSPAAPAGLAVVVAGVSRPSAPAGGQGVQLGAAPYASQGAGSYATPLPQQPGGYAPTPNYAQPPIVGTVVSTAPVLAPY